MKKNRVPINLYKPQQTDKVLIDTNVLLKLFYPLSFDTKSDEYETLFASLIKAKTHLIISSIQISEFINRCIRIQFNLYKDSLHNNNLEFKKDYRSTRDYKEKMNAILDIVKTDILKNFIFIDDGFSNMKIEKIFLYGFSYDFNDSLIVEIVRQNKAILITDDADFANYGADFLIVTSNKFLLISH